GHGENQKIEPAQEFVFLVHRENAVGQLALGVARAGHAIDIRARLDAGAREHVDLQSKRLCLPRRLASDSAVTPEADDRTADLVLESLVAIPNAALLVADHATQVAREIDHH